MSPGTTPASDHCQPIAQRYIFTKLNLPPALTSCSITFFILHHQRKASQVVPLLPLCRITSFACIRSFLKPDFLAYVLRHKIKTNPLTKFTNFPSRVIRYCMAHSKCSACATLVECAARLILCLVIVAGLIGNTAFVGVTVDA